jgi:hypothetical protein
MADVGERGDLREIPTNDASEQESASCVVPSDYSPVTVWLPRTALARLAAEPRVASGELTVSEYCGGVLFEEAYRLPCPPVAPQRLRVIKGGKSQP